MDNEPMYIACKRGKSRKLIAVATWQGGNETCLAWFDDCLAYHGIDHNALVTSWYSSVTKQGNFAGFAPDCQHFTEAPELIERWSDTQHVKWLLLNHTPDYIRDVYPNWSSVLDDLIAGEVTQ